MLHSNFILQETFLLLKLLRTQALLEKFEWVLLSELDELLANFHTLQTIDAWKKYVLEDEINKLVVKINWYML